ncbi:MAG: class I SAM-dependent methyltransferase [Pseudomonadota bacterium]|nr:MAG: class I SAM-dependent methyltransferase [Pseudomonadota bacterium]
MAFDDHFSPLAEPYARYRPAYPKELFRWLASNCAHHSLAWDAGTGNGQAAVALAVHFEHVVATDASFSQVSRARADKGVHYAVMRSEQAAIGTGTVDLVTVAQALHWYRLDEFYDGVRQVLRPGGVLAAWCYGLCTVTPAVDAVILHLYRDVLGEYWPTERRHIDTAYQSLAFPFRRLKTPEFFMAQRWTLDALVGYLSTWSAGARFARATQQHAVALVRSELESAWGEPENRQQVCWPLSLLVGHP